MDDTSSPGRDGAQTLARRTPQTRGRTFADSEAFSRRLAALGLFHMDLSLARITAALNGLRLQKPQAVVQIVGTNGKGSTAAFLEAIALAHGISAGLFTSPHLISPRERIRIDGRFVRSRLWLEAANAVAVAYPGAATAIEPDELSERNELGEPGEPGEPGPLTYFELLTAMAAHIFRLSGVRAAIYEAGLGARHDATCALDRDLVLFTPIAADHEKIIGPGVADIARDKSFAMASGMAAVSCAQTPQVSAILAARANEKGVVLETASRLPDWLGGAALGLRGDHQADNAALAVAGFLRLARLIGLTPNPESIRTGLARAFIPGRLQYLPPQSATDAPGLILDGAHNPHALAGLARALAAARLAPRALVFACMADKDVAAMIPPAASLSPGPIYLPALPGCPRAMPPKDVAALLGPRARTCAGAADALAALRGATGPVLICGSLYLLAEFFKLRPRALFGPNAARRRFASSRLFPCP